MTEDYTNKNILPALKGGGAKPGEDFPDKWLLVRFSSLGDVVLSTGLMRYLNQRFGWRFAVLTKAAFAPLFENNPFVSELIAPKDDLLNIPGSLGFFRALSKGHKGWGLLDLHGSLRSRLLGFMWRGPVCAYPKFAAERRKFLNNNNPELSTLLRGHSVTQRYAMAVLDAVPPPADLLPEIYLGHTEKNWASLHLAALRQGSASASGCPAPLVALHPFATHASKTWPRAYWLELMAFLDAAGMSYFIVGQGEPFLRESPYDFTGRTNLRQLAALLAEADLLVSGDSGPMHLSGAAGTPVVAIFGPTVAEWGFFPAGPHDKILELALPCRPCSLHGAAEQGMPCEGACMRGISPETVFAAVESLLAEL